MNFCFLVWSCPSVGFYTYIHHSLLLSLSSLFLHPSISLSLFLPFSFHFFLNQVDFTPKVGRIEALSAKGHLNFSYTLYPLTFPLPLTIALSMTEITIQSLSSSVRAAKVVVKALFVTRSIAALSFEEVNFLSFPLSLSLSFFLLFSSLVYILLILNSNFSAFL